MTLTDVIGRSTKIFHSFPTNKKDQPRKLKRLNKSIIDLFPQQQVTHFENSKEQVKQPNASLHPSWLMTPSELSRSISNRSITFASVFDEQDNENNNHTPSDHEASPANEDLVIIVPNKNDLNEPIVSSSDAEPYPFRSQIPSCLLRKSCSLKNITRPSHQKRKPFHLLVRYHRPKKLRHPVKTIQSGNSIDRSKSTPDLLLSSSSSSARSSITNDHHRSLKTIRQWFGSSSLGRFIQSFINHPTGHPNTSNTKQLKRKFPSKSIASSEYSDLIY